MATLTKEQVEQKLQQLKQLAGEVNALTKELAEAGVIRLSEEDLEKVSGGRPTMERGAGSIEDEDLQKLIPDRSQKEEKCVIWNIGGVDYKIPVSSLIPR